MAIIKKNSLSFFSLVLVICLAPASTAVASHKPVSGLFQMSKELEVQTQHELLEVGHRRQHARELAGTSYRTSAVSVGEKFPDLSEAVQLLVKNHLPPSWQKQAGRISAAVVKESTRYSMDPLFILAVVANESNFNPLAKGSQGEIGLMQLMPKTAVWINEKYKLGYRSALQLKDPVMNIKLGAAYLSYLRERFDRQSRLYLAAYNMGSNKLHRSLAAQKVPKKYSNQVMAHYLKYYNQLLKIDQTATAVHRSIAG